jgi:hypothetical protein
VKRGISGKSIRLNENDCNTIVRTNNKGKHLLYLLSLFLYEYALGKSSMLFHTTQREKYFAKNYHYLLSSMILNGTQCLNIKPTYFLKEFSYNLIMGEFKHI